MATVLIGWELGGGLGHLRGVEPIVRGVIARGHRPVLVSPDAGRVARVFPRKMLTSIPSPIDHGPGISGFRARSFADILTRFGFAEPMRIGPLVDAWDDILELVQPDLVIAEHAPTLCLAVFRKRPLIRVGTGFALPPTNGPEFPVVDPSATALPSSSRLLTSLTHVQRVRRAEVPDHVPELFGWGEPVLRVLPEIDSYGPREFPHPSGPFHSLPERTNGNTPERDYFAYLRGKPDRWLPVIKALHRQDRRGWLYSGTLDSQTKRNLSTVGVDVLTEPADLTEMLPKVRAVIHHGGCGVTQAAIAAGVPQGVLPNHLEQQLTAARLVRLGIGTPLPIGGANAALTAALRSLFENNQPVRAVANQIAESLDRLQLESVRERTLDLCETLIDS